MHTGIYTHFNPYKQPKFGLCFKTRLSQESPEIWFMCMYGKSKCPSLEMNFAMRMILCPQHSHIIKHITNVLYFIPGICFHYVLLHYHILISIINTFVPKLHSSTRMFRFQFNLSSIQVLIHN